MKCASRAIAVQGDVVSRVRVSQFQTSPEMITRVVIDLARPVAYAIAPDGERLAVLVGEGVSTAEIAPRAGDHRRGAGSRGL